MKKMLSVVAVAMFLCAGNAFAAEMPGIPDVDLNIQYDEGLLGQKIAAGLEVGNGKAIMNNVHNETTLDDSMVMNENAQVDIGVIQNSNGGIMNNVTNKTTLRNGSMVMTKDTRTGLTGEVGKAFTPTQTRIGVVTQK